MLGKLISLWDIYRLRSMNPAVQESAVHALIRRGSVYGVRPVARLARLLRHARADVRYAAAQVIGSWGWVAEDALIDALHSGPAAVSAAAAMGLGLVGNARAVEALIEAHAVDPLIDMLRKRSHDDSAVAVEALGRLGDPRAVEALIEALELGKQSELCAEALGKIGDARAKEPLIRALCNWKAGVKQATAAEALAQLAEPKWRSFIGPHVLDNLAECGDPRAVDALINALETWWDQSAAAEALGKSKDPRVVEPLVRTLCCKSKSSKVRKASAQALGRLGDVRALEPLVQALRGPDDPLDRLLRKDDEKQDDDEISAAAARALGKLGNARALEPLLEALRRGGFETRKAAAEALGSLGEGRAVEPLICTLRGEEHSRAAAEALAELKDMRAVEPLVMTLVHPCYRVRYYAAQALAKLGQPQWQRAFYGEDRYYFMRLAKCDQRAPDLLLHALKTGQESRRVAEALGQLGDSRAVEHLLRAFRRGDSFLRCACAEALGEIGDSQAVMPLAEALEDKTRNAIAAAALALGAIGDLRAVEPLLQLLATGGGEHELLRYEVGDYLNGEYVIVTREHRQEDYNWWRYKNRAAAARALAQLRHTRAIEPLRQALDTVPVPAAQALYRLGDTRCMDSLIQWLEDRDRWRDFRSEAAVALGELGDPGAIKALLSVLDEDRSDALAVDAAEALAKLGEVRGVDSLIRALECPDKDVRRNAVIALGLLRDPRGVTPLINVLGDAYEQVRYAATEWLGTLEDIRAVGPLIQALGTDKSSEVRCKAAEALGNLHDASAIPPLRECAVEDNEHISVHVRDAARGALVKLGSSEQWTR